MKSALFLLRKYICIYLFCSFYPAIVAAEPGGFLYLKFLCYINPASKPVYPVCNINDPSMCPPTFTICISNQYVKEEIKEEMCNIHHQKTRIYYNNDLNCNNPDGNKTYLDIEIKKELLIPLPKTYFVKIEARAAPSRNDQLIASFGAEFNQIPSPNMSQVVYKEMNMNRTDLRITNYNVSLDISMALQCDRNRYGEYCLDLCKPNSPNRFPCSNDVPEICKKGWKGEKCDTKDICAFVSCIKDGQCLEINGNAECLCNNQTGPHCYSNYNPCSNNTCQNGGICTPKNVSEIGYIFNCKCLQGFHGTFCELNIFNENDFNSFFRKKIFFICSLFFGILLIILFTAFIACFIRKRRAKRNRKLQQMNQKPISKNELERKINSLEVIKNQHSDVPGT